MVDELAFMNLDDDGFMRREHGGSSGPYEVYRIDNFRIFRYSDKPDATFVFGATDENGIAGFSYCLDHEPNTQPDEALDEVEPLTEKERESVKVRLGGERESAGKDSGTAETAKTPSSPRTEGDAQAAATRGTMGAVAVSPDTRHLSPVTWAAKTYRGVADGRWHFHVRAQDKPGNWGRANHYLVVIDREPPVVRFAVERERVGALERESEGRASKIGDGGSPRPPAHSLTGSPAHPLEKRVAPTDKGTPTDTSRSIANPPSPDTRHPSPLSSPAHSLTGSPAHPWHTPIRIETRDTCGVDPYSVLLEVDGQTYDADNRGFDFDPTTGLISFLPAKASPRPVLFADGQRVKVRLLKATDHLGRPYVVDEESRASVPLAKAAIRPGEIALHSAASNPKSQIQSAVRRTKSPGTLETEYAVTSPLKLTPANPDGKNGWYVTMPTFVLATESTETTEAVGARVGSRTESPKPTSSAESAKSAKSAVPSPSPVTRHPSPASPPSVDWLRAKTGDPHAQRGNMVNMLIVRGKLPGQVAPVYGKLVKIDTP
ncbi:MAG: hypothetical protein FJ272_11935, partial [Planctomycetes bacterium]|nr:hypothetical protein [Planctomycetota bacterium]